RSPRPSAFPYTTLFRSHRKALNYLGLALAQRGEYALARDAFERAGATAMAERMAAQLAEEEAAAAQRAAEEAAAAQRAAAEATRSEEHTSELQSRENLV